MASTAKTKSNNSVALIEKDEYESKWWKIFDIHKKRPMPDKDKKYKTSFRQITSYLLVPFKGMFITTLVLSIVQSVLFLALPVLGGDILTEIVENEDFSLIVDNFAVLFISLILMAGVAYLRLYMNQFMGNSIIKTLRYELFQSIQSSSYKFLDHHATGDLMSRCTSDLNTLKALLSSQITFFIRQCLTVFMALIAMFVINPLLAALVLPIFPVIFYIIYRFKKRIGPLYRTSRDIYGDEVTATLEENIGGVRVVRAFATEEYEIGKFNKFNDKYLDKQKELMKLQVTFEPVVRLFVNLGMAITIFVGGALLGQGTLYIGDLFSFLLLLNFAIQPLFFINTFLGNTAMYLQTSDRICEVLNNEEYIKEPRGNRIFRLSEKGNELFEKLDQYGLDKAKHEKSSGRWKLRRSKSEFEIDDELENMDDMLQKVVLLVGKGINDWDSIQDELDLSEEDLKKLYTEKIDLWSLEGAKWLKRPVHGVVKFDGVSLSYRDDEFHELKDISFETKPGEVIAILGATGSGKTSIIRLIGRFYEYNEGAITIDGLNIREITKKELRTLIGFVPQESFLFSTSLKENLSIGRPDGVEMDDIIKACKLANIHDFIDGLPDKYETVVGQRGVTLSGGQRQRISIARALIKKPSILILDDATSSVDVDTEYKIQQSFSTMFESSTTFIITQRLSSVRNADRIMVLENGEIVQFDTHDKLMADENGIYHRLYTTLKVEERAQEGL